MSKDKGHYVRPVFGTGHSCQKPFGGSNIFSSRLPVLRGDEGEPRIFVKSSCDNVTRAASGQTDSGDVQGTDICVSLPYE